MTHKPVNLSKRVLVASVPAALGNVGLLLFWLGGLDHLFQPQYWGPNPLGALLFFYFYACIITAAGLAVLVLFASVLPSFGANRLVLTGGFIALGSVLGAIMFGWSPDPRLFAACGALSALVFVTTSPGIFATD